MRMKEASSSEGGTSLAGYVLAFTHLYFDGRSGVRFWWYFQLCWSVFPFSRSETGAGQDELPAAGKCSFVSDSCCLLLGKLECSTFNSITKSCILALLCLPWGNHWDRLLFSQICKDKFFITHQTACSFSACSTEYSWAPQLWACSRKRAERIW